MKPQSLKMVAALFAAFALGMIAFAAFQQEGGRVSYRIVEAPEEGMAVVPFDVDLGDIVPGDGGYAETLFILNTTQMRSTYNYTFTFNSAASATLDESFYYFTLTLEFPDGTKGSISGDPSDVNCLVKELSPGTYNVTVKISFGSKDTAKPVDITDLVVLMVEKVDSAPPGCAVPQK